MVGTRLNNQMNFGNAPFFPDTTQVICVNGSHEEIEFNRAADHVLLSDPGAFFEALMTIEPFDREWFDLNRQKRGEWVDKTLAEIPQLEDNKIHPLRLALDVQTALGDSDWLVIDGGNTHFWSEIAVNIAGWKGQKLSNILHPGTFSMLGVRVPFATAAKLNNPDDTVVVISGDGAFLSCGSSIEAAFQEGLPIVVIIDNNGGLDCISQQQERLFSNQKHFATDFRVIEQVDISQAPTNSEYELVFHSADYFAKKSLPGTADSVMNTVVIRFSMPDAQQRYHFPVMLSPHSYSVWSSQ